MRYYEGVTFPESIALLCDQGRFAEATAALGRLSEACGDDRTRRACLDEIQILGRIREDYHRDEDDIAAALRKDIPDVSAAEIRAWTESGVLESQVIDGRTLYFDRAVVNLYRLSPEAQSRRAAFTQATPSGDTGVSNIEFDLLGHMRSMLDLAKRNGPGYQAPFRVDLDYALTVAPGKVPPGETIRCWLPVPRDSGQNNGLRLAATDPEGCLLSSPEAPHRALYLERPAPGPDESPSFRASYSFTTSAYVPLVDPRAVEPYDTASELYKTYTAERRLHVTLSKAVRETAAAIVGAETNPYLKARRIFEWFDRNITYTAAPEYSTIPDIAGYCLARRRGDCGMQALLYIALCRAVGLPARWQSGLTIIPGKAGLHDWAMLYVEPYGWIPVDPSRGFRKTDDEEVRWFYFGNIDAYRVVVNEDYGRGFERPKEHLRSETVDFQRGEVEWRGGNLFFSDWDYDIKVRYGAP